MPAPSAHKDLVSRRRQSVASARLRGLSIREIRLVLENQGIINPKTGKSFGVAVIHSDLVELTREWHLSAGKSIAELKAQKLAELAEVKRAAWQAKNFSAILQAIERECKVLGLDATQVVKIMEEHEVFKKLIFEALERLSDDARQVFIGYLESPLRCLPG